MNQPTPQSAAVARPGKYLVVTLGGESYGIPVLQIGRAHV